MIEFKGKAQRLTKEDLLNLAHLSNIDEALLKAFMEVESSGSGFDSQDRPKMLFEPHLFFRNLRTTPEAQKKAVSQKIAYQTWGTLRYPSDSYPSLIKAVVVNKEAALMSASWGLSQILGSNHKLIGYATVHEMIEKFKESEYNHVLGMIRFLENRKIIDDLRNHNWAEVARVYNGPSYAAHQYHTKLEKAYLKHKNNK
jgi:hypothetical protein